ncbi:MAG: head completion protein [Candidatus Izemoplasma sp.]
MAYKGKYTPKNPRKYNGDSSKIIYRSLWERKYMVHCDTDPNIVKWSSEEVVIPYRCDTDMKMHRYYMDFWVRYSKPDPHGYLEALIEVKPYAQTQDPLTFNTKNPFSKTKKAKKKTKRILRESYTYVKNMSKWRAALKYCKKRNWRFIILTEYGLGLKKR